MKKTLILKSNRGDFEQYYLENMGHPNVVTMPFFREMNEWIRYISILHIQKLNLPGYSFWYGDWKKNIKEFNNIILFDRNYNWNIIKYIHKKNAQCRIIVWYWNPIAKITRVPAQYRKYCEEWSFDLEDCKKYGLQYNTQFSFSEKLLSAQLNSDKIEYDVYFVGYDKGRMTLIQKIKRMLCAEGLKPNFIVVKDKTSKSEFKYSENGISYKKNLQLLNKSKCVLELVQSGQNGLTVRCIEALFLNKKLITNNKEIINYDFYHPDNILVIDHNFSQTLLKRFLQTKYVNISPNLLKKYDFSSWLDSFNL